MDRYIPYIYMFLPPFLFYSAILNTGTVDIHSSFFFSSYLFLFRMKPEECLILIWIVSLSLSYLFLGPIRSLYAIIIAITALL